MRGWGQNYTKCSSGGQFYYKLVLPFPHIFLDIFWTIGSATVSVPKINPALCKQCISCFILEIPPSTQCVNISPVPACVLTGSPFQLFSQHMTVATLDVVFPSLRLFLSEPIILQEELWPVPDQVWNKNSVSNVRSPSLLFS